MDAHHGKDLVVAFFDGVGQAELAARLLVRDASEAGRTRAIGILSLDARNVVAVRRIGDHLPGEKSDIDAVLAVIRSTVSDPEVSLTSGFFDPERGLSLDDMARFGALLEATQAALAVLEGSPQAERAVIRLAMLGAQTEVHHLTDEALRSARSLARADPGAGHHRDQGPDPRPRPMR